MKGIAPIDQANGGDIGFDPTRWHDMPMDNMDPHWADERVSLTDGFIMDVAHIPPNTVTRKGTILLLSPIFGIDVGFVQTMRDWSEAGYHSVAPDYFGRVSPGPIDHSDSGFSKAIARARAIDPVTMLSDLECIARHFASPGPLFVGGYCAGGEPALKLLLAGVADGCVIFHAGRLGRYADRLRGVSRPLDMHFGGADMLVPMEEVDRIREAAIGNPHIRITVHAGAGHGFTQTSGRNFQAEAATSAFAAARSTLDSIID